MTTSPPKMTKKIIIIGSGFSSISAATYLADNGYDVTILEKNSSFGGRARNFKAKGFTFDMGPSWYWMPMFLKNILMTLTSLLVIIII